MIIHTYPPSLEARERAVIHLLEHFALQMAHTGTLQEMQTAELLGLVADCIRSGRSEQLALCIRRWNLD